MSLTLPPIEPEVLEEFIKHALVQMRTKKMLRRHERLELEQLGERLWLRGSA